LCLFQEPIQVPIEDFERSGNSGRRQVWLLTATGLVGGAITIVVVGLVQLYIGSQREFHNKTRDQLHQIVGALEQTSAVEREDLFALLTDRTLPDRNTETKFNDVGQWRTAAAAFGGAGHGSLEDELMESFQSTAKAVADLESIRSEADHWHTAYRQALSKLDEVRNQTRATVDSLRAHLIQLDGTDRLATSLKLRQLTTADKSKVYELAPEVIETFRAQSTSASSRRELSELAVFVEQLSGARRRDGLTDLMDNNIKPCLSRLRATLPDDESKTILTELEKRLLGEGFVFDEAHQTVIPGDNGLYRSRREAFDLEERRTELTALIQANLDSLRGAIDEVDRQSQALTQQLASSSEQALSLAWIILAVVAALCAAVFVLLARSIARTIAAQIQAIGLRTKELARSQKFESIGQMAAGIADEITAPLETAIEQIDLLSKASGKVLEVVKALQRNLVDAVSATTWHERKGELDTLVGRHQSEKIPEQMTGAIVASRDGIERAIRIAQAMRQFSRPASQEKVATDLNEAVRTTVTVTANWWKYVAVLRTDLDADLPYFVCQPAEINQLLLNLVVNAADAVAEKVSAGSRELGTILIRTRVADEHVVIEVHDTGCGIAEDIRERIFDPFFTTKAAGKGAGMGLAMCYNIVVNVHGGNIVVESSPGVGSIFRVTLPLRVAENSLIPPGSREHRPEPAEATMLGV
jgi:signal transduction histidine kinase